MKMDKHTLVLDIIEHPQNYSAQRLREILSDPETREIYNLFCMTDSALKTQGETDVDAEWENFAASYPEPRRRFLNMFGSRAATIAVIVCGSLVAVAAGIAMTVAVREHRAEPNEIIAIDKPADVAHEERAPVIPKVVNEAEPAVSPEPVTFEDTPLETILTHVAATYGVEVRFNNPDAASLHLYYQFDPSLSLEEVVTQLNTFEQINLTLTGNILTID